MSNDEILTIRELANYLRIAEKTAYKYVAEGKIPGFKVGAPGDLEKMILCSGLMHKKTFKAE